MFSAVVSKSVAKIAIILNIQAMFAKKISQNPKKVVHHPADCMSCGDEA